MVWFYLLECSLLAMWGLCKYKGEGGDISYYRCGATDEIIPKLKVWI